MWFPQGGASTESAVLPSMVIVRGERGEMKLERPGDDAGRLNGPRNRIVFSNGTSDQIGDPLVVGGEQGGGAGRGSRAGADVWVGSRVGGSRVGADVWADTREWRHVWVGAGWEPMLGERAGGPGRG